MSNFAFADVRAARFDAARFVNCAKQYDGTKVKVQRLDGEKQVDAKSLLGVLSLDLKGKDVRILVCGVNQSKNQEIANKLAELIA